jgi:hypothetical protein
MWPKLRPISEQTSRPSLGHELRLDLEAVPLEKWFNAVLPQVARTEIAPQEFRAYFDEVRRRWEQAA